MSWWEQGLRLLLAVIIGCVIGIERERKNRPAGMRTHVLVCVGASIIAIMESLMIADTITLNMNNESTGIAISYGRISAQVISGIGFLGAGTIISTQASRVRGLTTAAGLWAAACIGLAIGIGFFEAAIGATVVVMLTIVVFQRVDHFFYTRSPILRVYLEMESIDYVKGLIRTIDGDASVEQVQQAVSEILETL